MRSQILVGILNHRAKLERVKTLAAQTDDFPEMENLTTIIQLDAERDDPKHWQQEQDAKQRKQNVQQPLAPIIEPRRFPHNLDARCTLNNLMSRRILLR